MLKIGSTVAPGDWVKLVSAPEWGVGQVQSVVGAKVTVNFEHAGKRVVQSDVVMLEQVETERR
jgi:hypothetical protein